MRLDRNLNPDGKGKYALIKLRVAEPVVIESAFAQSGYQKPLRYELDADAVDFGDTPETDFFVIRLQDKYAAAALRAYAMEAGNDDPEYAADIFELVERAENMESRRPD
jgi:hypothetical protein